MKIASIETIKEGVGAKGKPWILVKIGFEGQKMWHTGFIYEPLAVGAEVDVELYQEEYQGKMQNKFKIASKKATNAGGFTDMDRTRMMSIEALCIHINNVLNREFKDKNDKTPVYPEYNGQPDFSPEQLEETDRPF